MSSTFLTATWSYLAMINYEVPPELLLPHVPKGTELDSWQGKTMASMVGFMFLDTRLKGVPVPFHRNFEEVNLRFYVRREHAGEIKRGVVFIKEIVPKSALALVARVVYNENYVAMPMDHDMNIVDGTPQGPVSYRWQHQGRWNSMSVTPQGKAFLPDADSEASFIAEHYWGYAMQRDGSTVEYEVQHPPWEAWMASASNFDCDVAGIYGPEFAECLSGQPSSAFLARGSEVSVLSGHPLKI